MAFSVSITDLVYLEVNYTARQKHSQGVIMHCLTKLYISLVLFSFPAVFLLTDDETEISGRLLIPNKEMQCLTK